MNDKEIWIKFVEPQWDEHLKHSPEDGEPGYRACPKCFIEVFKKGYIQGRQDERKRILKMFEEGLYGRFRTYYFGLTDNCIVCGLGHKNHHHRHGSTICENGTVVSEKRPYNQVQFILWSDLRKILNKIKSGERGTRVSPDGSPAPRGADLTDEPSGSGSPAKTKKGEEDDSKEEMLAGL